MSAQALTRQALERYKALVFDLDGTLADSMPVWADVAPRWFAARGLSLSPEDRDALPSMTLARSAEFLAQKYRLPVPPGKICGEWLALVEEEYRLRIPLKPGAGEFIREQRLAGKTLAIATSCFPAACRVFLERHGLLSFWDAFFYPEGMAESKNDSRFFLRIARTLGMPPEDCLVFEDSLFALRGAKEAGMSAAAVYDRRDDWAGLCLHADFMVRRWDAGGLVPDSHT